MLAPRAVKRKTAAEAGPTPAELMPIDKAETGIDDSHTSLGETEASCSEQENGQLGANVSPEISTARQSPEATEAITVAEDAEPVASTSQLQPDPGQEKKKKQERERLSLLRFTLEECLSDWGISCQHPELLKKLENSQTGCTW